MREIKAFIRFSTNSVHRVSTVDLTGHILMADFSFHRVFPEALETLDPQEKRDLL